MSLPPTLFGNLRGTRSMRRIILAAMCLLPSYALAADFCNTAKQQYIATMNTMVLRQAAIEADNSAPRATLANIKINNDLLAASMNLAQMIARKCPLPDVVASANPNPVKSTRCATALLTQHLAEVQGTLTAEAAKLPEECR